MFSRYVFQNIVLQTISHKSWRLMWFSHKISLKQIDKNYVYRRKLANCLAFVNELFWIFWSHLEQAETFSRERRCSWVHPWRSPISSVRTKHRYTVWCLGQWEFINKDSSFMAHGPWTCLALSCFNFKSRSGSYHVWLIFVDFPVWSSSRKPDIISN